MHTHGNGKWVSTKSWVDPKRIHRKSWHFRRFFWRDECWFLEQNETQWNKYWNKYWTKFWMKYWNKMKPTCAQILKQIYIECVTDLKNVEIILFLQKQKKNEPESPIQSSGPRNTSHQKSFWTRATAAWTKELGTACSFFRGKKEPWEEENTASIRHPQITEDVDSCWHHEVSWRWWNVHA